MVNCYHCSAKVTDSAEYDENGYYCNDSKACNERRLDQDATD